MPLRDELIQRAIQQLATSFARLLGRNAEIASGAGGLEARVDAEGAGGQPAQESLPAAEAEAIRAQLDKLYSTFMGSSPQLVRRLSSDDLLRVLGSAGYVDGERAYLLSSLLETEAQLALSLGATASDDQVLDLRTRALDLMLEAGIVGLGEPDIAARATRLRGGVPPAVRSPSTWERLVWFGFESGDYAWAEDALFAWLDVEQSADDDAGGHVSSELVGSEPVGGDRAGSERVGSERVGSVGESLYGRLSALEDEALSAGGLPREELEEGREELRLRLA